MQFVHHIFNITLYVRYIIYILVYIICIYKSIFVLFSLFKILTTCKMVGLHPTIKGRPLNPTIRWAIRTQYTSPDRDSISQCWWWYTLIAFVVINPTTMRSLPRRTFLVTYKCDILVVLSHQQTYIKSLEKKNAMSNIQCLSFWRFVVSSIFWI
jgi:hypothetical protein